MEKPTTHFGYRDVPITDKQGLVGAVFSSVASRYDLMNDLMSLGLHRLWKRHFVATAGVRAGDRVLDLAGGTGDIAALLAPRVGDAGLVVLSDINARMLERGRDRILDEGHGARVGCARLNAQALPFPDRSFDVATIAFGLRNVTDQSAALAEMRRVLRPGGRALVLEFSEVRQPVLKPLYDLYSFSVLPLLGRVVAKDEASYRYLAESIRKHPNQERLAGLMREAGLERVSVRNLLGGIVAIHSGYAV
ncbi:MAG: bifunctional demethylmenaquinone methyltransferase/2-methoxy-6-polyprenyl-1,4-benzoquinol methylase UbiE [Xanthomonadales bacterium]|nr:Ubiquinone/menaquinone biosynthesis C-methyltransferase UbiE [Xanthomonadales bacterium]MCC6593718.1 bifunctional demethylmenaquinone methyltransferase/2-methoxy-6-polyprenyl-1,4-benzoquinol methylase UbiE [Xanthomonadales bacterium]MCE7930656.1 bifunctional demethylmenaquinone methyltransferase/2-methoxy-6-polyprenyl-1,4-benzoquinol methylase UbiE [Xanthomonadales bacterium PRO6]